MSVSPTATARAVSSWSTSAPHAAPVTSTPRKPALEVVTAPEPRASLGVFLAGCVALLGLTIAAILILNVEMAHGAYKQTDMKAQLSHEVLVTEQLSSDLDDVSTAENLAQRARDLGMVQELTPGVIRLEDKTILVEPDGK